MAGIDVSCVIESGPASHPRPLWLLSFTLVAEATTGRQPSPRFKEGETLAMKLMVSSVRRGCFGDFEFRVSG
jgi:hypothetical protein